MTDTLSDVLLGFIEQSLGVQQPLSKIYSSHVADLMALRNALIQGLSDHNFSMIDMGFLVLQGSYGGMHAILDLNLQAIAEMKLGGFGSPTLSKFLQDCLPCGLEFSGVGELSSDFFPKVEQAIERLMRALSTVVAALIDIYSPGAVESDICNILNGLGQLCIPDLHRVAAVLQSRVEGLVEAFGRLLEQQVQSFTMTGVVGGLAAEALGSQIGIAVVKNPLSCAEALLETYMDRLGVKELGDIAGIEILTRAVQMSGRVTLDEVLGNFSSYSEVHKAVQGFARENPLKEMEDAMASYLRCGLEWIAFAKQFLASSQMLLLIGVVLRVRLQGGEVICGERGLEQGGMTARVLSEVLSEPSSSGLFSSGFRDVLGIVSRDAEAAALSTGAESSDTLRSCAVESTEIRGES